MKKRVLLLFFILFAFSAIASAQVEIAGQSFSMLVVVPLVLMIVFMLIFGIVVAFDKYNERKERKELESGKEDHGLGIISAVKEKLRKTEEKEEEKPEKKEEKKETTKEKEHLPLAVYLDDIRSLRKKIKKLNAEKAFDELVVLIRHFFSDYLGIDYEFTFDELEKEFKSKNKEVVFFSKNLSDMSYNAEDISKKNVVKLLDEFEDVAEKIILKEDTEIGKEKKKEVTKPEEKKSETREMKKIEEVKKREYVEEDKKGRVIGLIREGRRYIKRDINKANDIYEEVYVLYHQLSKNNKKEIKKKITDFYNAIRMELKS